MSVFVNPPSSNGCSVVKLSDALKSYWISSGNAVEAERCKRDFEKGK